MRIDLTNYETFLIDYLDGKLTDTEVEEVLAFLENHPEIKEEFEGLNEISFQTESISFDAAFLHKPRFADVKQHYEPLLVAELEGDLGIADQLILQEGFIKYPELQREQQLFANTIFVSEKSLVFPGKSALRKGNVFVLYRREIASVAAILLVTALAGITWLQFNRETTPQTAQVTIPQTNQQSQNQQNSTVTTPQSAPQYAAHKAQPAHTESVQRIAVQPKHFVAITVINPKQKTILEQATAVIEAPLLSRADTWLKYTPPAVSKQEDYFVSLPEYLKEKLASETKQLEQKTKTTIQEMNKTAGISIQKDSSGRITHFGIDALGFAWSQSK